jgi:hypothetical protein
VRCCRCAGPPGGGRSNGNPHRRLSGRFLFRPPAHTPTFSSPLAALAFSRRLWVGSAELWGLPAHGSGATQH